MWFAIAGGASDRSGSAEPNLAELSRSGRYSFRCTCDDDCLLRCFSRAIIAPGQLRDLPMAGTYHRARGGQVSVSSMTDVAISRRTDDLGTGRPLRTARELSEATAGKPETESALTAAAKAVATYILTEVIGLYLAALAAVRSGVTPTIPNASVSEDLAQRAAILTPPSTAEIRTTVIFAVIAPIVVWLVYAGKAKTAGKNLPLRPTCWPLWEMFAATAAFVAWSFALPDSPFARFSWYNLAWATFVVLGVSTLLGLFAPVFQRPLKT